MQYERLPSIQRTFQMTIYHWTRWIQCMPLTPSLVPSTLIGANASQFLRKSFSSAKRRLQNSGSMQNSTCRKWRILVASLAKFPARQIACQGSSQDEIVARRYKHDRLGGNHLEDCIEEKQWSRPVWTCLSSLLFVFSCCFGYGTLSVLTWLM